MNAIARATALLLLVLPVVSKSDGAIPIPDPILPMILSGAAKVTSTKWDLGDQTAPFDGKMNTMLRTPSINPAFLQIEFAKPYSTRCMFVQVAERSNYRVACADSTSDMESRSGTYRDLTGLRQTDDLGRALLRLPAKTAARIYRLDTRRLAGDNYVHIFEWQFCKLVPATSLRVEQVPSRPEWKPSSIFPSHGVVRLKAVASAQGVDVDVSNRARFESPGFKQYRPGHPNELLAPRVAANETRDATINAVFEGKRASLPVKITGWETKNRFPDVDVLYIERTPRIDFDAPDKGNGPGWPAYDQPVNWVAHMRSYGREVDNLACEWKLDGAVVAKGTIRRIEKDGETTERLPWRWDQKRHSLEFSVAPPADDYCSGNNRRTICTDALAVGFWVEERLADHWHDLQHDENPLNNSFEDWAQWMMERWNSMMEEAKWPLSPNGLTDRWRLDRIMVVPSGALPLEGGLPSNDPCMTDKTVDIQWGFNVDPDAQISNYWKFAPFTGKNYADHPPAFYIDWALLHEMSHARYLIDSYGFDVHADSIKILTPNGTPAIDTPEMRAIIPHFNKYVGLMGGVLPPVYDEYTAGALERVKGRRARGGNYNSPSVIGEYIQDLPSKNTFTFFDPEGNPLSSAKLSIWRAHPVPTAWYGKLFEGYPDTEAVLDANGRATLPRNPFGADPLQHTFGYANTTMLMRLTTPAGQIYYHIQEVSDFNLEYWKGHRDEGLYTVQLKAPKS